MILNNPNIIVWHTGDFDYKLQEKSALAFALYCCYANTFSSIDKSFDKRIVFAKLSQATAPAQLAGFS